MVEDDFTSLADQVRVVRNRMAERFDEFRVVSDPVLLALSEELDRLIIRLLRRQNAVAGQAAERADPPATRPRPQAANPAG